MAQTTAPKPKSWIETLENVSRYFERNTPRVIRLISPLLAYAIAILLTIFIPVTAGPEMDHLGTNMAVYILWAQSIMLALVSIALFTSIISAVSDSRISFAEILRTLAFGALGYYILMFAIGPKLYSIYIASTGLREFIPENYSFSMLITAATSGLSANFKPNDIIPGIENMTPAEYKALVAEAYNQGIYYVSREQFSKLLVFEYCNMALLGDIVWNILITFLALASVPTLENMYIGKAKKSDDINTKINAKIEDKFKMAVEWLDIITGDLTGVDWKNGSIATNLIPSNQLIAKVGSDQRKMEEFVKKIEGFINNRLILTAADDLKVDKPDIMKPDEALYSKITKKNSSIKSACAGFIGNINQNFGLSLKKT